MNLIYILFLLKAASSLLHPGNSNDLVEDLKNNVTTLINVVERMQSQFASMELQNKLMNRTIELQQRLLIDQKQNMSRQEKELSSLRHQLVITESKLNRTAEVHMNEIITMQNLLNTHQADLSHLRDDINVSKALLPEVEKNRQLIGRLEKQANKTDSAYNIILTDLVDKLNLYRNESEKNLFNFKRGFEDFKKQFHYVSLSTLATVNRLTVLNTTTSTWLQKLESRQLDLNSSSVHSLLDTRNVLEVLNSTIQGEVRNVAFTVSLQSTLNNYNNKKVMYDKIITNIGNGYDVQTGEFTCPHSGVYVFTWSAMSWYLKSCDAFIYRNGARLLEAYSAEGSGSSYAMASNTAVFELSVGDEVWIQTGTCDNNHKYPYTAFSGWKL